METSNLSNERRLADVVVVLRDEHTAADVLAHDLSQQTQHARLRHERLFLVDVILVREVGIAARRLLFATDRWRCVRGRTLLTRSRALSLQNIISSRLITVASCTCTSKDWTLPSLTSARALPFRTMTSIWRSPSASALGGFDRISGEGGSRRIKTSSRSLTVLCTAELRVGRVAHLHG